MKLLLRTHLKNSIIYLVYLAKHAKHIFGKSSYQASIVRNFIVVYFRFGLIGIFEVKLLFFFLSRKTFFKYMTLPEIPQLKICFSRLCWSFISSWDCVTYVRPWCRLDLQFTSKDIAGFALFCITSASAISANFKSYFQIPTDRLQLCWNKIIYVWWSLFHLLLIKVPLNVKVLLLLDTLHTYQKTLLFLFRKTVCILCNGLPSSLKVRVIDTRLTHMVHRKFWPSWIPIELKKISLSLQSHLNKFSLGCTSLFRFLSLKTNYRAVVSLSSYIAMLFIIHHTS